MSEKITVERLYIYPIKAVKGIEVSKIYLTNGVVKYDRMLMLIDQNDNMITQRSDPKLSLLDSTLEESFFNVISPSGNKVQIDLDNLSSKSDPFLVKIWKDEVKVVEVCHEGSKFFSEYLGKPLRLIKMSGDFKRARLSFSKKEPFEVNFADGYPLLLCNESSLSDLNKRLETPVTIERFRPNILVSGLPAYSEDNLSAFTIGEINFSFGKLCDRCQVPNVDLKDGKFKKEPMATLSRYRNTKEGVMFGVNCLFLNDGSISIKENLIPKN